MILLIDHYDSFVYNLARYFERLGHSARVVRFDAIDSVKIESLNPTAIVFSPGPCSPNEATSSQKIVQKFAERLPILGVCLGHQIITTALGGRVVRAKKPVHGQTSSITHDGQREFLGIENPFTATRYHSLVTLEKNLPADLCVSARTDDSLLMAIRHRRLPIFGWQFHPESILTECGYRLLAGFLRESGLSHETPPIENQQRTHRPRIDTDKPRQPITF